MDSRDLSEVHVALRKYRRIRAEVARRDVNEFNEMVLRDERTSARIKQAPMHVRFHDLCDRHRRVVIMSHIESAKTNQLSVGRLLWLLGKDPTQRFAVISGTNAQATKIVRAAGRYILESQELREVFPKLLPSSPWTSNSFTVQRPTRAKDASVVVTSVHLDSGLGSRFDGVFLDDILTKENTATEAARDALWSWLTRSVFSRLTANAFVIAVGTPFHPDDALHRMAKNPLWHFARVPVIDDTGMLSWPERWPVERIEERRIELGPMEFARQMLCVARDDSSTTFKREWVDACITAGEGLSISYSLDDIERAIAEDYEPRTYTGVDLGTRDKVGADLTVLFTIQQLPDGRRKVLSCESGRWRGREIVDRIVDVQRRFNSIVWVENNAAQQFILDFVGDTALPIFPFTTGKNKAHPEFGVESIAAEMANGGWVIPSSGGVLHPELSAWVSDLLYYDPRAHTGDRLMASWFAREGARAADRGPAVSMTVIGGAPAAEPARPRPTSEHTAKALICVRLCAGVSEYEARSAIAKLGGLLFDSGGLFFLAGYTRPVESVLSDAIAQSYVERDV